MQTDRLSSRESLAFTVFSLWAVTGLFLDGWSHNHHRPETFFTPWHAVLYSGVSLGILWFVREGARTGTTIRPIDALAAMLMIGGGVADMIWHLVFGIEVGIGALLSPTHLTLMTGGLIFVSGPLRSAWRDPDAELDGVVAVSAALSVALLAFFTMFLSGFRTTSPGFADASGGIGETIAIVGVASVLWSNLLLVAPVIALTRRWRTSPFTILVVAGIPAIGMVGIDSFRHAALVVPVLAGALVASRVAPRWRGVVLAATTWPLFFATYAIFYDLRWSAEAWTGTCFLCALSAAALSVALLAPTPETEPRLVRSGRAGG